MYTATGTKPDFSKLIRVLGTLGSAGDGEVCTAGRMANRMIAVSGLSWADVINTSEIPPLVRLFEDDLPSSLSKLGGDLPVDQAARIGRSVNRVVVTAMKTTWEGILKEPKPAPRESPKPEPRPTPPSQTSPDLRSSNWRIRAQSCLMFPEYLFPDEPGFLHGVAARNSISQKQWAWLTKICDRIIRRRAGLP